MKLFSILFIMSFLSFAATSDCHKIEDDLDREYCVKKSERNYNKRFNNIWSTYKKNLTPQKKASFVKVVGNELSMLEQQEKSIARKRAFLNNLKAQAVKTSVKTAKKKKKKKKKFKDMLRDVGIKL